VQIYKIFLILRISLEALNGLEAFSYKQPDNQAFPQPDTVLYFIKYI